MSKARAILLLGAALALSGCGKDDSGKNGSAEPAPAKSEAKKSTPNPASATATASEGRRVRIEVTKSGYSPARVDAAAGEKLVLVFDRTEKTECGRYVKVGANPAETELPLGQEVEIPITMPDSGEVPFTCGMNMMKGSLVVAEK